jgi:hypothetical protein
VCKGDIAEVLDDALGTPSPGRIHALIRGQSPSPLQGLISGSLDLDKIEYLSPERIEHILEAGKIVRPPFWRQGGWIAAAAAVLFFPMVLMGRWGADALSLPANWRYVILIAALAILFLFSVKKQTEYVSKRVNHHCPPQSSGS